MLCLLLIAIFVYLFAVYKQIYNERRTNNKDYDHAYINDFKYCFYIAPTFTVFRYIVIRLSKDSYYKNLPSKYTEAQK